MVETSPSQPEGYVDFLIFRLPQQTQTVYLHYILHHFQRKLKQKVVADYTTVSKGVSGSFKPRAALRQVLFSQGVTEKSPMPEVLSSHALNLSSTHMNTPRYPHAQTCFASATVHILTENRNSANAHSNCSLKHICYEPISNKI